VKAGNLKRSGPGVLAVTAMALTLGFAGVEEGVVLCLGGDGHVAFEATGPEGCSYGPKAASRAASLVAVPLSSSHCGPCVDVALTTSSVTERVASAKRTRPPAAGMSIAALASTAPRQGALVSQGAPTPFISGTPHTVVIRC
jgi:hypothetical protein